MTVWCVGNMVGQIFQEEIKCPNGVNRNVLVEETDKRVYPPPPCSGATCPKEVAQICPPTAPCDRGGAARVCPVNKTKKDHRHSGGIPIPVLHELTEQNPNHLEGPVFLAEKLVFLCNEVEEMCDPLEVACETTSIHWPLHFTEGTQTEPIDVIPLPVCSDCVTELRGSNDCMLFDEALNVVSVGRQLTVEECVSPTCELIEVARECTSVHRPPLTDSFAQTDPVRTIPRPVATECTEVVTGIERQRIDATHDKVIVHTDRVCYDADTGCERLLSRSGQVIMRPPQEVARVSLPDRVVIEERASNVGDEVDTSEITRTRRSTRSSSPSGRRTPST
ncbi:unnamed protein product [Notodromas monacha]|uniref:Uncharacterized protein n=1 Tax=Notodromas monacha TaxID=399045 RepID=A0A7R9BFP0_9CRUS|nr:unnamed protein product [Notodromas monacha]CAG0914417.1 unnamed protein product [Notodromas monacha]